MADNPSRFLYMTKDEFAEVFEDLNVDIDELGGFDSKRSKRLMDRAVSDLEADLVKRFVIPLVSAAGTAFEFAPTYGQFKVKSAIMSKLRELIGQNKQKNVVIDSTERFIDLKKATYRQHIKDLLDHERIYGLKLQEFAEDGSLNPVQQVGIARPETRRSTEFEDEDIVF